MERGVWMWTEKFFSSRKIYVKLSWSHLVVLGAPGDKLMSSFAVSLVKLGIPHSRLLLFSFFSQRTPTLHWFLWSNWSNTRLTILQKFHHPSQNHIIFYNLFEMIAAIASCHQVNMLVCCYFYSSTSMEVPSGNINFTAHYPFDLNVHQVVLTEICRLGKYDSNHGFHRLVCLLYKQ